MPTVSVIIPTYKHRDFVLETLNSVFAQTFTDYEVIVINDGSPDDTAELLRPLAEAGRIRYVEQQNTGQSTARNRGIALAGGEFIALLDDDDLWPPDKLQWQVEAMARYPNAGLVAGIVDAVDMSGQPVYRSEFVPEISFERCFTQCPFTSPGQTLIRASVLRQVHGLNPGIWGTDDWDLWLRIAKVSRVVMEDRIALIYRRHPGSASQNLCRMLDNCFRVVAIHQPDLFGENRRKVMHAAYVRLYAQHGRPIMQQIKQAIRAGELRRLPAYLASLAQFGRRPHRDPVVVLHVIRDLLPVRWATHLHE